MGWTSFHKPESQSPVDCLLNEFGAAERERIVATARVGSAVYMAHKSPASDYSRKVYEVAADGTVTTALVFLTSSRGDEFAYKDMDETMGPCESTCPARILDLLSPIRRDAIEADRARGGGGAEYAQNWRDRCRANIAGKREALKLEDGMKVRLPEPIRFRNGAEVGEFIVRIHAPRFGRKRGRVLFQGPGGGYYAIGTDARRKLIAVAS